MIFILIRTYELLLSVRLTITMTVTSIISDNSKKYLNLPFECAEEVQIIIKSEYLVSLY